MVACLLLPPACDRVFQLEDPDAGIDEPAGQCGAGYQGQRYLIEVAPTTWLAAETRCEALDERADDKWHSHLIVLTDRIESAQLGLPVLSEMWTGMISIDRGPFRWITSEVTPPPPWDEGKPSSDSEDRCGKVEEANLSLDDTSCGGSLGYVCECDLDPVTASFAGL